MSVTNTDIEKLILTMAEYRGEVKAFKDILDRTLDRDKEQFNTLTVEVKEINEKLNELLVREARREGEFTGVKRTAVVIAGVISLIVGIISALVTPYV